MSIEEDFNYTPLPQEVVPAEPKYPIDVAKLTEAQRNKIVEDIRNFERLNQMIADNNAITDANKTLEKRNAQAAAAGGGMQPPTEPANTSAEFVTTIRNKEDVDLQAQLDEKIARNDRFIDNNIAIERHTAAMQQPVEPRETEMVPQATLQAMTEKMQRDREDRERLKEMIAENNASTANSVPKIPPQTEPNPMNPAFVKPEDESMLDKASRLSGKAAEYVGDKVADNMQYGFLGALEPKLERLGIRLMSAPRRMLFEGLYKWRSERAFTSNEDLKKALAVVEEKEKALAAQDAGRDAFLANEKKNGWSIGSSAGKFETERRNAVKRIEAAKQNADAMRVKLEKWNTKKTHWENRQKDVARDMVSKVNLHPKVVTANADFMALTKRKENIVNQLGVWESARTKAQEHLAKLEADLQSAGITYTEEEEITGQIENIKKILAEGNKKYKDYVGRKNAADSKMGKINTYLGGWNNFKNELGRTGENNKYDEPGPQPKVAVAGDRTPTQSHAPQT